MSAIGSRGVVWRTFAASMLALVVWSRGTAGPRSAYATEQVPVFLSFVGAPDCDDRSALEREVERRTDIVSWTTTPSTPTRVDVRVADGVGRVDSVVFVQRPGSPGVTRAITGSSCQEVIEGTALIIAVLLSPSAEEQAKVPASAAKPPPKPVQRPILQERGRGLRWRFGGGASAVLVEGIAPGWLPGVEAFVGVGADGDGWAPTFRLSFRHLGRSGFAADGGQAAFRLDSGAVSACPAAFWLSPSWALRPCATGTYGVLEASGVVDAQTERGERHPWAGVGGGLRLEARLLSALSLELEATSEAALVSSRFWFGATTFHESSRIAGRVGLSVFAKIP